MKKEKLLATLFFSFLLIISTAFAQDAPVIENLDSTSHPPIPSGLKVTCLQGPDTLESSVTCPVIKWGGYTYWAYSHIDNRVAMTIVAYDAAGNVAQQWEQAGARYVWQITLDSTAQRVMFWGQANHTIEMNWVELFFIQSSADDNLLVNGDGAAGDMTGWTITANGGNGWHVINGEFTTSYHWAKRTQSIDLLASGFTAEQLDEAPEIVISQDVRYTYCPDSYYIKVELLDATQSPIAVFDTGIVSQTGDCSWSSPWDTITHIFSDYGSGVRYIRWEDGGDDSEYWWGQYGPVFDNARVEVYLPEEQEYAFYGTHNPGYPVQVDRHPDTFTLIPDDRYGAAGVVWVPSRYAPPFDIEFEYATWDNDGGNIWNSASGVVAMFCKNQTAYDQGPIPVGGSKGFIADGSGYGVHFPTYGYNRGIELTDGDGKMLHRVDDSSVYSHGAWRHVKIEVRADAIQVFYEGMHVLTFNGAVNCTDQGVGFGAATGWADSQHEVRIIALQSAPAQAGPEANVLFIVDDSGSMDSEVLTRDVNNLGRFTATQPDGTSPVGTGSVTHRDSNDDGLPDCNFGQNGQAFFGYIYIVEFGENTYGDNSNDCNTADDRAWRIRNSDFNPLYFNPTRTYTPWSGVNKLGHPFPDMPVTAALANPYDPDSEAINLLVHNSNWLSERERGTSDRDNDGNPDGFFFYTWTDTNNNELFDDGEETEHQLNHLDPAFLASWGQTAAQVQQNFANWFSYYRSRELATKAAYGKIIAAAIHVRMGLTTLHNNNHVNTPIRSMNDDATTGNKRLLLDALYSMHASNGTPLRQALLQAGRYLECTTNSLFSECPVLAQAEGGESQQHFIVMMTDGTYNGPSPNVGNTDGDFDSDWDGGAYADAYANTLADVAMYFYERDLHPGLDDRVPTIPGVDDATHQHVVTYTLALGLEGSLISNPPTPEDSFPWPNPATSPIAKIDDLRHAAYNGRGEFFSVPEPEAFLTALEDLMQSIVSRIDQPLGE